LNRGHILRDERMLVKGSTGSVCLPHAAAAESVLALLGRDTKVVDTVGAVVYIGDITVLTAILLFSTVPFARIFRGG
jgi:hypothetical protein